MRQASIICALVFAALTIRSDAACSFDNCPADDESVYTVHVVPHTHMDLGWLKTVDQYFYGTRGNITSVAVQYIYDSVVTELLTDPQKRFIFVETGFFDLWWNHRNNATRENFKKLVENGQIEFISGGYVMNDEAASYYMNVIDQMSYGLGILKDLFGECGVSRIGWQIDPFGHSREFASILSQMGFKGLFLGRIDYQDKDQRQSTKTMEFTWQASESLPQSQLTGIVLPNNYSPPPNLCYDIFCSDDVIVEDIDSPEYNAHIKVRELMNYVTEQAKFYATNNQIITFGMDFHYMNAHKWMENLDALIRQVNGKGYAVNNLPLRLVYSTPSCYLKSIQNQKKVVKTDDFFPYASDPHAYWTGYFTSRPAFKFLDRFANNLFQAAKQLTAMAGIGTELLSDLRRGLAIGQHHDAISGTEKQHVNNDYTRKISKGLTGAEAATKAALAALGSIRKEDIILCRNLNISQCDQVESIINDTGINVLAYNPFSAATHSYLRVPITDGSKKYTVTDQTGQKIPFDVLPIPYGVRKLAERNGTATHEIVFPIDIPALGFTSVAIKIDKTRRSPAVVSVSSAITTKTTIERGGTTIVVDPKTGISQITMNGLTTYVNQGYSYYDSHTGDNKVFENRASGAYIFRPATGAVTQIPLTQQRIVKGAVITEIRNTYSDWLHDTVRINDKGEIEFDWVIGPIPVKAPVGKEIIWRINTDIDCGKTFYTDSNGRENLMRVRNFRPTWNVSVQETVAANYYPVNSRIAIKDKNRELGILVDRSVGGTNLAGGAIEIMLHRRCLQDDAFGVDEALNEPGFDGKGLQIRGSHRLVLNKPDGSQQRAVALQKALQPIIAFSRSSFDVAQKLVDPSALPANVHLLSLEQIGDKKQYLLRLENIFEQKDNNSTATVDLSKLFLARISNITETLLAANIARSSSRFGVPQTILLTPMQIRTFIITLQ